MKWFQKTLVAIATFNMVFSPVIASAAPEWTEKDKAQLAHYRDYLEPLGYRLTLDPKEKKALVYDKHTNKLAMEVPFAEEGELRKFSPKSLNHMLMEEMVRVKHASKASWSHSVRNLPAESAIFFVAMGAVVAGQLITNYSQNPIAMKQHIDHSLSPIGVFGFFTFMYSQGVTANVLSMYMKNPKFHHMIPYLGMTVGAFLQTYLSQVASDPNVMACAKVMMGKTITEKDQANGIDADPCSKAYEYLVLKKKLWEFAPGIVSMLISSGLAGVAQSVITKTVLRITGVDIALWLVPGTMQLKGIRLLLVKGLQITAFVAIDMWLNRIVVSTWKNMYDGAEFYDVNDSLNEKMNLMKKSRWSADSKDLQADLKEFRKKMTDWRMMNMSEVYEAHQSWSEALHQMTSMFNTSYSFYDAFVAEVRKARDENASNKFLTMTYPYNGVVAKGLTDDMKDTYYLKPQVLEGMQLKTINEGLENAENLLKSEDAKYLYPHEIKKITAILTKIRSGEREAIGLGLSELYEELGLAMQNISGSMNYKDTLRKIYDAFGRPNPMMEPGRGWVESYANAPMNEETVKDAKYYRQVGLFMTPKVTDYLVMQMICGPDLENGGRSVKNSRGFPSVFLPPQIGNSADQLNVCNNVGMAPLVAKNIYKFPIQTSNKKKYAGAIDYLISETRPTVIGTADEPAFQNWWKTRTEAQVQKAFEEYGKSYDEIVAKMVKAVYYPGRKFFNGRPLVTNPMKTLKIYFDSKTRNRYVEGGPVYNGAMNSAFQEERVYLSILGDLLQPAAEFNVDIAHILETDLNIPALQEVENQFAVLNGMMKRIKVTTMEGREVVESDLENYELEEQLQNIQGALKKLSEVLGVGDADPSSASVQLNKQQRDVAVTALEQLQGLATEVMMYGSMANAVSWSKIRNLKKLNIEQQRFNNEIQARLDAMRGISMPGKH
ncbi:MAG: hypothetical protein OM95_08335 [Bdellovibrio sp. ArHS]|uniref:hypothetical protein n=1 Tax=Bdellovibrio sp. ArHS TaxID=1569284 RepID=UPI000583D5C9|nr:hypothetical protein [Bdellovibrio sp. ArHS]KHD88509.1 MAG: hypothetical protein OM95_08335 [Bdellovibrio sp. ArHS]